MRILITSSYYWPELTGTAPYVAGMAEHFASSGHDVTVTTAFPHYPDWKPLMKRRLWQAEDRRGVRIKRRWTYIPKSHSAVSRAAYEGTLFSTGLSALPMRRHEVVIGISPTSSCIHALAASKIYQCPYGLIFHDIIGQAAQQSGVKGGAQVGGLVSSVEHALVRRASVVGVYSEGMRSHFLSTGIRDSSIKRLRPWTLRWEPTESRDAARVRLGWGSDFVVLHAGNMGFKQGLDNVIDAAATIGERDVRVVLAGDGNRREQLERRREKLGVRNVAFVPGQPWGSYEAMLEACDVLLVNQRAAVSDMAFPSKLTSYFRSGRPVIAAVAKDSDTAREIESAGAGIVVSPEEPAALSEAILELRGRHGYRNELGQRGNEYAEEKLTASRVLGAYDEFLADLCEQSA